MALGSTQPLTEMSTMYFPGGKWRPARKDDNHLFAAFLEKVWQPRRITTLRASMACYKESFILPLLDM
jgi:hypothetical protein